MTHAAAPTAECPTVATRTLGAVSFLNARPLVHALVGRDDIRLAADVPSRLSALLDAGRCDAALLPVVDHHRARGRLRLVSDACIASDGETMTVRVYSRVPPDRVRRLHVDADSHTSVVLGQLVWRELYDRRLDVEPYRADAAGDVEAVLLIGDKVVGGPPHGFGFEVDLGAAWKHLTGLPFVFAAWCAPAGDVDLALAGLLEAARDHGVAHAAEIASECAPLHGWPVQTAVRYLRDVMRYTMTPAMRAGMERFFELSGRHGLL